MPAFYQRELDYTAALLERMRLPMRCLHPGEPISGLDSGIRQLLGVEEDYGEMARVAGYRANAHTIYKTVDRFMCCYIYFMLPGAAPAQVVLIGPYLTADPTSATLLEMLEALGRPLSLLPELTDRYAALPVYHDPAPILAIVSTLGGTLWPGADFDMVDVEQEQHSSLDAASASAPMEQKDILYRMKQMEERYAFENELMEIVSTGQINRADGILGNVSALNFQQRSADPLRNMKNYCIISNTLLRKAAQQGGVHPLYLDEMSSRFARMIESMPTLDKCSGLMADMIRSYCRLVRTHNGRSYSATVQKVQTYIDANLSGDLSLTTLAALMQVTPSYLSTLFHRETGHTLARYITQVRMKAALQLLRTTRLQIQNIAQLCGFGDPNYFGKQFKRYYGVTPLQYQREQAGHASRKDAP